MTAVDQDLRDELKKRMGFVRQLAAQLVRGSSKVEGDFSEEVWQEMAKDARALEANAQLVAIALEQGIRTSTETKTV